jgi:expansin (peptidoglycan-binding protein)
VLSDLAGTNPVRQGIATYYEATGEGACMFAPSPDDLMVAAMNAEEYGQAAFRGAQVRVTGPRGTVTVRIVDLCPECRAGHLDLSREAFGRVGDLPWSKAGRCSPHSITISKKWSVTVSGG